MIKQARPHSQPDLPEFKRDELVEYHGKTSKTIPRETVVRVCCEATTTKTVVEARTVEGVVTQIVLANKFLKKHKSLF